MLITNNENEGIAVNPDKIVGVECYSYIHGTDDKESFGIRFLGSHDSLVWKFETKQDRDFAYQCFLTSANRPNI